MAAPVCRLKVTIPRHTATALGGKGWGVVWNDNHELPPAMAFLRNIATLVLYTFLVFFQLVCLVAIFLGWRGRGDPSVSKEASCWSIN